MGIQDPGAAPGMQGPMGDSAPVATDVDGATARGYARPAGDIDSMGGDDDAWRPRGVHRPAWKAGRHRDPRCPEEGEPRRRHAHRHRRRGRWRRRARAPPRGHGDSVRRVDGHGGCSRRPSRGGVRPQRVPRHGGAVGCFPVPDGGCTDSGYPGRRTRAGRRPDRRRGPSLPPRPLGKGDGRVPLQDIGAVRACRQGGWRHRHPRNAGEPGQSVPRRRRHAHRADTEGRRGNGNPLPWLRHTRQAVPQRDRRAAGAAETGAHRGRTRHRVDRDACAPKVPGGRYRKRR